MKLPVLSTTAARFGPRKAVHTRLEYRSFLPHEDIFHKYLEAGSHRILYNLE